MELNDILAGNIDQDRGVWFDIVDPVAGTPTGIRFRVAGPDSETQRKARLALADELAELADENGIVSAEGREKARINSLARCVLGFEIKEAGEPIPFNHSNVVRVLKAGTWLQSQVDSAAGDRSLFRGDAA
ncbi:hypothetical protein [Ahrensia sp. 13_GOM-1096m]|uniref:hypothetical protein n=1 Tax=Ahrensia sp. 13_GOM-1096m TaxID=1380380 RepID=UPI00047B9851|nr:hypothetical protein [Ahrensia sp. 13_GOM-1096m]